MSYYMEFLKLDENCTVFDLIDKYDELVLKYPQCLWSIMELVDSIIDRRFPTITDQSYMEHFGMPRQRSADFDYSTVSL